MNNVSRPELLDFRNAAFYAFTKFYTEANGYHMNPLEPCFAYYFDLDSGDATQYLQLVSPTAGATATIKPVHLILPQSLAAELEPDLMDEYACITRVGETRAYGDTLGVDVMGNDHAISLNNIIDTVSNGSAMDVYLNNFLDTHDGYNDLLNVVTAKNPGMTPEDFYFITKDINYAQIKYKYIEHYTELPVNQRRGLVDYHMNQLLGVFSKPEPDVIGEMYTNYLNTDDFDLLADYADKTRLLKTRNGLFDGLSNIGVM